jgi:pimeloyl-ACP methyl ester carboxylesterase
MISPLVESLNAARCSDAFYFSDEVEGFELIWEHSVLNHAVGVYASSTVPGWYLLTFRGSEQLMDWVTNLRIRPWPSGPHHGYSKAWAQLKDTVLGFLALLPDLEHLTICGHSMGGALAQLALLDIEIPSHLITFGSPKALDPPAAKKAVSSARKTLRFIYGGDLVVLFPFRLLQHVGHPIQVGPKRTFWRLFAGPWDHHPRNYVQALSAEA